MKTVALGLHTGFISRFPVNWPNFGIKVQRLQRGLKAKAPALRTPGL
jgi:hypothetical protein